MKIYRVETSSGSIVHAVCHGENRYELLTGEVLRGDLKLTGKSVEVRRLLSPIQPTAILCVGLNYRAHAIETGAKIPEYPVLFMKNVASVQHPEAPIILPRHLRADEVDYEAELTVVIGRDAKNVSQEKALDYVAGYTIANDVSARDWQLRRSGSQWCRAKSFDTFCPLGPCLVTTDEIPNPNQLQVSTRIGSDILQNANTSDMIFSVAALIEFLSGSTTLQAGSIILTGTPSGVGMGRTPKRWIQPGEVVEIEIEKIGWLKNPVIEENV